METPITDPWDLCVLTSCESLKVGEIPPCPTPREYTRALRTYWTHDLPLPESLLKHPFGKQFPPAVALLYLMGKRNTPTIFSKGSQFLHLPELCQLALLWAIAGQIEEARELGGWILAHLGSLWCPESEYEEGKLSLSLLRRAFGQPPKSLKTPIDPYFIALAKKCPLLGSFEKPPKEMETTFILTGEKSGMGTISLSDVEIRAMGPQPLPLGSLDAFGIHFASDELNQNWTRCHAFPEVWIEVKSKIEETDCELNLRFLGLEADKPLAFAFYIKAHQCQIGNQLFRPKSLQRYAGNATTFLFKGSKSPLRIESTQHKVQLIPLAGEGGFWDTEFILAFEISPSNPIASFRFSKA